MIYEGVNEIDAVDLLETIGLDNVLAIGRGEIQFSCPYTNNHSFGDSHPSAHLNEDKLVYRCKGCGRAGTALELVCVMLKLTPVEGLRWLRERFGDSFRPLQEGGIAAEMAKLQDGWESRNKAISRRLPNDEETIGPKGIFKHDWASDHPASIYMHSRGFDVDILERWNLGFDSWTNRITIPVRDENDRLVGFKGRALPPNDEVRYLLLGDTEDRKLRYGTGYWFDMHDPTEVVFGLASAAMSQAGLAPRKAVVNEGEFNALALQQADVANAVAIGTTTITLPQQRLLRWYFDELVLFYDPDQAGHAAVWGWYDEKERWYPGIVEKMSPYMPISVVIGHDADPASTRRDLLPEMVAGACSWMEIAVA